MKHGCVDFRCEDSLQVVVLYCQLDAKGGQERQARVCQMRIDARVTETFDQVLVRC